MLELVLSTIPDSDDDTQMLTTLVSEFGAQHNLSVTLHPLTWEQAWSDLVTFALQGKGPHLSHIGGSWTGSLAIMNALRPFKPREITEMGGAGAFLSAAWDSAILEGDPRLWSIPWTGYVYVICYRKDLLQSVGVDHTQAFGSVVALKDTVDRLSRSSLEIPWLVPAISHPFTDYIHIAASWVWGAGGEFIDIAGKRVAFTSPEALHGLTGWLETHRAVPAVYRSLDAAQTVQEFIDGRAAAVLTDIRTAASLVADAPNPTVHDNLGVAPVTNVPWCGGGSFIIWQHTQGYPEHERAAVELVQFLVSKEAQVRWANRVHSMPSRINALHEIFPESHPLHDAVDVAIRHGRAYQNVPLWRRMEHQLALELGECVRVVQQDPSVDAEKVLLEHLAPLARRLNLILGS
ncbi:MAG: extracellular solute-binding protein [Anaerolineales bacterium]|nr:extracellular solute-binding protein [Anaerolineales bacterium]